jgi:transposase
MQDADSNPPALDAVPAPPLPDDLPSCHALIVEQLRALLKLQADLAKLQLQNAELDSYVKRLLNRLYGRRSERVVCDPRQQPLDFGDEPEAAETAAQRQAMLEAQAIIDEYRQRQRTRKEKNKNKPRDEVFPDFIPRYEVFVELPIEQQTCDQHGAKKLIGYDCTQSLEYEPPKLRVRVTKYGKYVCQGFPTCGVEQPQRPTGLVEGNRYDTSVAAQIITDKYCYHLPLYREQDRFASLGWTPSRSTLVNIVASGERVLHPLADYYRQLALASGGIGCDDTRLTLVVPTELPYLDPAHARTRRIREVLQEAIDKQQPSVTAHMWAYRSIELPINVFDFTVSRHRDGPAEILQNYSGFLLGDCYAGFDGIALGSHERIVRIACWAHARRKILDLERNHAPVASVLLAMIGQLYEIESRGQRLSAADRVALRQRESRPILARIRDYLDSPALAGALPKSELALNTGYLRNNWELLVRYTTDGRCPIDNNDTEQLMKQVAVGRKNWLFVGSLRAGERAATLMTVVSTAIRNSLDVAIYLQDVLDQLLKGCTDYHSLCAHVWKESHPSAVRTYRIDERRDAADRQQFRRAQRRLAEL